MDVGRVCKKLCSSGSGDGGKDEEEGRWEDLNPEILALIFGRFTADELVRIVSLVCKSWLEFVAAPYCWTDIDVIQWCRRSRRPELVDSAVRKLVRRSKGTFRRLSANRLGDAGFAFAANFARCLKVLQMPMSAVSDDMVERHAGSLLSLTVLDISYCVKITSRGIEALGKSCKSLIDLKRNMPFLKWEQSTRVKVDDSEAVAIADTMQGLSHLEFRFGCFSDLGLTAILTKCKALAHLDIQGSWNVLLEGDLREKAQQLPFFADPDVDDYADLGSSQDDDTEGDEESSSSELD